MLLYTRSPRDSEWDADVSHGSRDSQLGNFTAVVASKVDWGGGPSYGGCGLVLEPGDPGGGRDYSLLSRCRKSSTVTFDVGQPGIRRHSSSTPSILTTASATTTGTISNTFGARRRLSVIAAGELDRLAELRHPPSTSHRVRGALSTASGGVQPPSGRRNSSGVGCVSDGVARSADDFRSHSAQFRKRNSSGDQSIISLRIDEDDGNSYDERLVEEEEDDDDESTMQRTKQQVDVEMTTTTTTPNLGETGNKPVSIGTESKNIANCCVRTESTTLNRQQLPSSDRQRLSKTYANYTDDSDVERRVAKLFYEIEFSATDVSVDQSSPAEIVGASRRMPRSASSRRAFVSDTNQISLAEVKTQTSFDYGLDERHPSVSWRTTFHIQVENTSNKICS